MARYNLLRKIFMTLSSLLVMQKILNQTKKAVGPVVFCIFAMFALPTPSKADIDYIFIKVDCNKSSKAGTFKIPYFEDKDRDKLFNDVQKGKVEDLYEFDDMADKNQLIKCELDDGQIITMNAGRSNHRANNGLTIKLNGVPIGGGQLIKLGKVEISVKSIQENIVSIKECPLTTSDTIEEGQCRQQYKELISKEIHYLGKDLDAKDKEYIKNQFSNKKNEGGAK